MSRGIARVQRFAAILCDMDGLLVNSEPAWAVAEAALVRRYGGQPDAAFAARLVGIGTTESVALLRSHFHLDADAATLEQQLIAAVIEAIASLDARPGATEVIPALAERYPLAVASGSPPQIIEAIVTRFGWERCFAALISSETLPAGKPAPDVFLAAARALAVPPERCLVLEDAPVGVTAAKAAGMTCYAIPSREYFTPDQFTHADAVLHRLTDVLDLIMDVER